MVEFVCDVIGITAFSLLVTYLFECTVNEAIFRIHNGRFRIGHCFFFNTSSRIVTMLHNFSLIRKGSDEFLNLTIVFQEFDCQIACRELTAKFAVLLQVLLHILDTMLNLMSVINVNMAYGILFELSFIDLNDGGKKVLHAFTSLEYCGNHRESQQFTQFIAIEFVTALFGFIEHVESTHHAEVHVDKLGREI